jgi:hypothetical protein
MRMHPTATTGTCNPDCPNFIVLIMNSAVFIGLFLARKEEASPSRRLPPSFLFIFLLSSFSSGQPMGRKEKEER